VAEVGDHYHADGDRVEPGVYRVVGTGAEVALLRVADADGRRAHTGEFVHVAPGGSCSRVATGSGAS
jgi:hypothetical protein